MSGPTPIAQGDLGATPLAHVIVSIVSKAMDGTLAVWPDEGVRGQDRIYFEGGRIRRAKLLSPGGSLERSLLPLFHRDGRPYAFYAEDLVGDDAVSGSLDPLALVAAAIRGGIPDTVVDDVLGRYGDSKLRITRGSDLARLELIAKEQTFVEMFRAVPQSVEEARHSAGSEKIARRVLYLLAITQCLEIFEGEYKRGSHPGIRPQEQQSHPPDRDSADDHGLPGLPSEFPPPPEPRPTPVRMSAPPRMTPTPARGSVRRATPSPMASLAPPGASNTGLPDDPDALEPPEGLTAALTTRWRETVDYAKALEDMNYFEMLEVDTAASSDAIRDAYFAKVKRWHPDRLPSELAPLAATADRIFHHLTEAQATLSDADERKKHFNAVEAGGGTPKADRQLATILGAAMEFQKVEVLVRRKDYVRARKILRTILEAVPDEADYHAMLGAVAWLEKGDEARDEAAQHLERALRIAPGHERAQMTKAQMLQREGKTAEAITIFRAVAEANPKNVDAVRQVRLADMRSASTAPKAKDDAGGFLSKFFGKKK